MSDESFYIYLTSRKGPGTNKSVATNVVPFHYTKTLGETAKWKVAALRGKLSKTWATTPKIRCDIRKTTGTKTDDIYFEIPAQRMIKVSEMTAKLREALTEALKELNQRPEDWVKFGGSGYAARKIVVQPGVSIIFSDGLKMVLRLDRYEYEAGAQSLDITIKGDLLNNAYYDVLYLTSQNIEGVLANNTVVKALTEITEDTKLYEAGDSIEFRKSNPTYHNWLGGDVSGTIEVRLTNSIEQPLEMEDGFLFVVLHFVKSL